MGTLGGSGARLELWPPHRLASTSSCLHTGLLGLRATLGASVHVKPKDGGRALNPLGFPAPAERWQAAASGIYSLPMAAIKNGPRLPNTNVLPSVPEVRSLPRVSKFNMSARLCSSWAREGKIHFLAFPSSQQSPSLPGPGPLPPPSKPTAADQVLLTVRRSDSAP